MRALLSTAFPTIHVLLSSDCHKIILFSLRSLMGSYASINSELISVSSVKMVKIYFFFQLAHCQLLRVTWPSTNG